MLTTKQKREILELANFKSDKDAGDLLEFAWKLKLKLHCITALVTEFEYEDYINANERTKT